MSHPAGGSSADVTASQPRASATQSGGSPASAMLPGEPVVAAKEAGAPPSPGQEPGTAGRASGRPGPRRRNRLVLVIACVVIVAAGLVIALKSVGSGSRLSAGGRPGWALPWPDHASGNVPQKVLDGAVIAWRHEAAAGKQVALAASARAPVAWYVGQTVAHGQVVAVMFEVNAHATQHLIAGYALASQVMHGQAGWVRNATPWVLYDVPAPPSTPGLAIGLNVHGVSTVSSQSPDNWIVVLAAPGVQTISWQAPSAPPGHSPPGNRRKPAASHGTAASGLLVANVGQVTGQVKLTALEAGGHNTLEAPEYVGVPGSPASLIPALAPPAPLHLPHGFKLISESAGQGDVATGFSHATGRLAVVARCYGTAPLRIMFSLGTRQVHLGNVRCDNRVHELVTHVHLKAAASSEGVSAFTGDLTSFRIASGIAG
jgi:hypothetical protein